MHFIRTDQDMRQSDLFMIEHKDCVILFSFVSIEFVFTFNYNNKTEYI